MREVYISIAFLFAYRQSAGETSALLSFCYKKNYQYVICQTNFRERLQNFPLLRRM
ncbi:MAG: hypothetical protein LBP59_03345 [Planctomycetaceae bacterium]|nr:hypothetical protein [Planctomycetaceae bacterium]